MIEAAGLLFSIDRVGYSNILVKIRIKMEMLKRSLSEQLEINHIYLFYANYKIEGVVSKVIDSHGWNWFPQGF